MSDKKYQITIRNWDKYQREMKGGEKRRKRRDWIAISTDLDRDIPFLELTIEQRYCWLMLLCHAGRVGAVFELSPSDARVLFKLRRSADFQALEKQGLIDLRAATRQDKTRQDKTRHIKEKLPLAAKTETQKNQPENPIDLDELKAIYPKRSGGNPWLKAVAAINARMKEGHTWQEIADGIRRYAAFCDHTGRTGGEYVKQAVTFCGPDKHFSEPWDLPRSKSESKQDSNAQVLRGWVSG